MFTLGCFSKNYDKRYRFNATIVNFVKKTILTPLTFLTIYQTTQDGYVTLQISQNHPDIIFTTHLSVLVEILAK